MIAPIYSILVNPNPPPTMRRIVPLINPGKTAAKTKEIPVNAAVIFRYLASDPANFSSLLN